jgi:hypothetical protein
MFKLLFNSQTFQRFIIAAIVVTLILWASQCSAQYNSDSTQYSLGGEMYKVETGPKGGKFIILGNGEKQYISGLSKSPQNYPSAPEGAETIIWEGKQYPIITGPKGGHYFIDEAGKKRYIKIKTNGESWLNN